MPQQETDLAAENKRLEQLSLERWAAWKNAEARANRAENEVTQLREALAPFARAGRHYSPYFPVETHDDFTTAEGIKLSDYRRAIAALKGAP